MGGNGGKQAKYSQSWHMRLWREEVGEALGEAGLQIGLNAGVAMLCAVHWFLLPAHNAVTQPTPFHRQFLLSKLIKAIPVKRQGHLAMKMLHFGNGLVRFAGEPNKVLRRPKHELGAFSDGKTEVQSIRPQMSAVSVSFLFPYISLLDSSCFRIFHGFPFPENAV